MRKYYLLIWLLAPIAGLAFHFGPGSDWLAREIAADCLSAAKSASARGDYEEAEKQYRLALEKFPDDSVFAAPRNRIRLAQARARMIKGELPEALEDMRAILAAAKNDPAQSAVEREARGALARAQYYAGWIMRLEGAKEDDWKKQTEAARQNYRMLAESASKEEDLQQAETHQKNLEAAVRLARMDLKKLMALPLPQECQGACKCGSVSDKLKKDDQKSKGEGQGDDKQEKIDARGKGAGESKRPEGVGS